MKQTFNTTGRSSRPATVCIDTPRAARRLVAALLAASCAMLSACSTTTIANQGQQHDVQATYSLGTLSAELPIEIGVPAARAAAEATLRSRGYVVTQSSGNKDRAMVVGNTRADREENSMTIEAWLSPAGTMVTIDAGNMSGGGAGGEAISRSMLDVMLGRLGR